MWSLRLVATRLNRYERLGLVWWILSITEDDFRNAAILGHETGKFIAVSNLCQDASGKIADILNGGGRIVLFNFPTPVCVFYKN